MRVLKNIVDVYKLDRVHGNSLWAEAIDQEVKLLRENFECFRVGDEFEITEDCKKIPLLWAFAIKFDKRHRAQLCAGGRRIRDTETGYYSRVVELEAVKF